MSFWQFGLWYIGWRLIHAVVLLAFSGLSAEAKRLASEVK